MNEISKPHRLSTPIVGIFACLPVFFIVVFFLIPLLNLAIKVIEIKNIWDTFHDQEILKITAFTFTQATASMIATLLVGIFPTYLLCRWEFRGRKFLSALVVVPFLLPTVVMASAFLKILPESLHNTVTAIVIVHMFFNVAVVVKVVGSLWSRIPLDLENASKTLGANSINRFTTVTLPLIRPALISAGAISFVFSFTSFGVIQIIGGPTNSTLEVEIARRALFLGDVQSAALLTFVQLLFIGVLAWVVSKLINNRSYSLRSEANSRIRPTTFKQKSFVFIGFLTIMLLTCLPIITIILSSFRIGNSWSSFAWSNLNDVSIRPGVNYGIDPLSSILVSLRYLIIATILSLFIGTCASIAITSSNKIGKLLEGSLMLPLATSAVTIGLGMLITFNTYPINWRASFWIVPIGHSLIAIPFVIRTIVPVLRARPLGWLDAGATLGANPIRLLLTIDLPTIKRPLVNAGAIAAAISIGEFGATTLLSRTGQDSMPIAIARLLDHTGDIPRAQAFVLCSILAIFTLMVVMAIEVRDA